MTSQGNVPNEEGAALPALTTDESHPQAPSVRDSSDGHVESIRPTSGEPVVGRLAKRDRPPRGGPGNVTLTREAARLQVALRLIWVLAGTIATLALLLATSRWTELSAGDTTTAFNTIITAVVTLIASAVGYYFGSENNANKPLGGDDE